MAKRGFFLPEVKGTVLKRFQAKILEENGPAFFDIIIFILGLRQSNLVAVLSNKKLSLTVILFFYLQ
jgi:hypothetical protein